jgi:hypothetical protein
MKGVRVVFQTVRTDNPVKVVHWYLNTAVGEVREIL